MRHLETWVVRMFFCCPHLGRLNSMFELQLGVVRGNVLSILVHVLRYLPVPKCHALPNILSTV